MTGIDVQRDRVTSAPGGGYVLDIARLTPVLALGWLLLLVASGLSALASVVHPELPLWPVRRLLAVDAETNLPKLYSLLLSLIAGVLAAGVALWIHRVLGRWRAVPWWFVATAMGLVATEDFMQLHDRVTRLVNDRIAPWQASPREWIALAFVAVLGLALLALVVLWRLPRRTRWLLVLAAGLFATGTVGLEMVGTFLYARPEGPGPLWLLVTTAEEFVEMAAVIVLVHGVIAHLRIAAGSTRVRLDLAPPR